MNRTESEFTLDVTQAVIDTENAIFGSASDTRFPPYSGYLAPHASLIVDLKHHGLKYQEIAEYLYDKEGVRAGPHFGERDAHCRAIKGLISFVVNRDKILKGPRTPMRGKELSEKINAALSAYRHGSMDKARLSSHISDLLSLFD